MFWHTKRNIYHSLKLFELKQTMQCEASKNTEKDELRSHVLLFDTIIHVWMCVLLLLFTVFRSFVRSFIRSFFRSGWEGRTNIYKHSQSVSQSVGGNFFSTQKTKMMCILCVLSLLHPYHVTQCYFCTFLFRLLWMDKYAKADWTIRAASFDTILRFNHVTSRRAKPLSNWRNLISAEAYMVCLIPILCQPVCVYLSFLLFVLFCIRIVFAEGCRHRQSHHFRIFFKKSICSSIGWFEKKETVIIFGSPRSPFYFDFHLIKYLFSLIEQNNVIFSHEYNDDNSINGIIRM